mmetsp:Transcript_33552/g.106438  ORF Transcript_33552/g.106438 Transcript_33552/m.106438 type:complete len:260 (-) Transcript_33552:123-902(-)
MSPPTDAQSPCWAHRQSALRLWPRLKSHRRIWIAVPRCHSLPRLLGRVHAAPPPGCGPVRFSRRLRRPVLASLALAVRHGAALAWARPRGGHLKAGAKTAVTAHHRGILHTAAGVAVAPWKPRRGLQLWLTSGRANGVSRRRTPWNLIRVPGGAGLRRRQDLPRSHLAGRPCWLPRRRAPRRCRQPRLQLRMRALRRRRPKRSTRARSWQCCPTVSLRTQAQAVMQSDCHDGPCADGPEARPRLAAKRMLSSSERHAAN